MILIIDTDKTWAYTKFSPDNQDVVLDGTYHVVAQFEVLERDDDGDANVIRELPHDWRPEVTI